MNAHGYVIAVIQLLQREFNLYSVITPKEFDVLYRWWEKGIPLNIIQESVANVMMRRQKAGKELTGIQNFVHTVRKIFSSHQEKTIGKDGRTENELSGEKVRNDFLNNPPADIADLVEKCFSGAEGTPGKEQIELFFQAMTDRFAEDEELRRRTVLFAQHLAPALRTETLLSRYRLNLLISRYNIPDMDVGI